MVGPSTHGAKGGMSQFIRQINHIDGCVIQEYQQFIDGGAIKRLAYMIVKAVYFPFIVGKYDIIHIHSAADLQALRKSYYIRVQKLFKKKVILHVHGQRFIDFYNESSKFIKTYVTNSLNLADVVIALSNTWKDNLEDIVGVRNCRVVYNGINLQDYADCLEHPESIKYNNYGLFLGRVGKRKGVYDLVSAVNKLSINNSDFKIIIAGDGDETPRVKELADDKQVFTGWVQGDDKLKLIKHCKFFVLPQYNEGVPIQIIEAMAAGKAILQTNVGGIPDIVDSQNGFLISPGDVDQLKKYIEILVNDDSLCRAMGLKSLEYSKKYSIEQCKSDILEIYKSLKTGGHVINEQDRKNT